MRDVFWAETRHQENLLNEITVWCNNQITDMKRSLYPAEDKSNSLGRAVSMLQTYKLYLVVAD